MGGMKVTTCVMDAAEGRRGDRLVARSSLEKMGRQNKNNDQRLVRKKTSQRILGLGMKTKARAGQIGKDSLPDNGSFVLRTENLTIPLRASKRNQMSSNVGSLQELCLCSPSRFQIGMELEVCRQAGALPRYLWAGITYGVLPNPYVHLVSLEKKPDWAVILPTLTIQSSGVKCPLAIVHHISGSRYFV